MFFSQYWEHCNVHTDSIKHKYPCRKTGCDKYYGSTRACNYHEQHQKPRTYKCSFKEKKGEPEHGVTCNSKQSLAVHVCGIHGEGWKAVVNITIGQPKEQSTKKNVQNVKTLRGKVQKNITRQRISLPEKKALLFVPII